MKNSKNPTIKATYDWYKNIKCLYDWKSNENKSYSVFIDKYKKDSDLQQFLSECDCLDSYLFLVTPEGFKPPTF